VSDGYPPRVRAVVLALLSAGDARFGAAVTAAEVNEIDGGKLDATLRGLRAAEAHGLVRRPGLAFWAPTPAGELLRGG
jgi:hypothetical protein